MMKIDKNKTVFISLIIVVLIFIVSYSMLVFTQEEQPEVLEHTQVPEIGEVQKTYESKIEALNAIEAERERTIPSMYSEDHLDSMGYYDPDLVERERHLAMDSIYTHGAIGLVKDDTSQILPSPLPSLSDSIREADLSVTDFVAAHEAFFLPGLREYENRPALQSDSGYPAVVNGKQVVRNKDRLELILKAPIHYRGIHLPRNSILYGFVSLQKNRVRITIPDLGPQGISLEAYDLQDGGKGIYIRNSFRAEAAREVLDDLVQDVNITGVPQISGIKNVFRRNNRNLRVSILDQYQLILRPKL